MSGETSPGPFDPTDYGEPLPLESFGLVGEYNESEEAEDIDKEVEELGDAEQLKNGFEFVGEHTERNAKSNEFQAEQTNAQDYLNKVEELAKKALLILEGRHQVMASRF